MTGPEAGFGDLGWSLERLKWPRDICLATPAAKTPSALCNVWVRDHIPSAVTNGTGHFLLSPYCGIQKHQKDPRELQIKPATQACPACSAILLFFVGNAHSWINLIFHIPVLLIPSDSMQNSACTQLLFSQEVHFLLGLKLRSVQGGSSPTVNCQHKPTPWEPDRTSPLLGHRTWNTTGKMLPLPRASESVCLVSEPFFPVLSPDLLLP